MRKLRGNDISMIFQEPMTSLNPVLTVGRQIGETLRLHQGMDAGAGHAAGDRRCWSWSASPLLRAAGARVPAPAFRRDAAAGDDRDGAGLQPEAADRRRADHGARRDDPGPDPRPDARPQDPARLGHHADHPRPGRGGGDGGAGGRDVRRPQGGGGAGERCRVRPAAAPLHARAAGGGAEARLLPGGQRAAGPSWRRYRGWCRACGSASLAARSPGAARW